MTPSYTPLEKSYLKTQAVITALIWLGLMLLPLFLLLADEFDGRNLIVICAEAVLLAAGLVNLAILPRAYAYKGYAVREHDITYRNCLPEDSYDTLLQDTAGQHPAESRLADVRTLCRGHCQRSSDAGGDRHPRTDT